MESSDQRPLKVDQGNLQTANQGVNNTKEAWLPWTTVNQERSRASERDNQAHILTIVIPVTRGSHLHVTCRSVCDQDQVYWSAKSVVGHLIVPFWGSWSLDFQGSKVTLQLCVLDCWLLAVWRSPWSLIGPPKGLWSLDSILIPVTNASTQDMQVITSWVTNTSIDAFMIKVWWNSITPQSWKHQ